MNVFAKPMFSNSYCVEITSEYAVIILSQFFYVDGTSSFGVTQNVSQSILDVPTHCEGVKSAYDKFNEVYQFVVANQQVAIFSHEVAEVVANMVDLINTKFGG